MRLYFCVITAQLLLAQANRCVHDACACALTGAPPNIQTSLRADCSRFMRGTVNPIDFTITVTSSTIWATKPGTETLRESATTISGASSKVKSATSDVVTITAPAVTRTAPRVTLTESTSTSTAPAITRSLTFTSNGATSTRTVTTVYTNVSPSTITASDTRTTTVAAQTITTYPSTITTTRTQYVTTRSINPTQNMKREMGATQTDLVTIRSSKIPMYASACRDREGYSSACACWGIKEVLTTIPASTRTRVVYPISIISRRNVAVPSSSSFGDGYVVTTTGDLLNFKHINVIRSTITVTPTKTVTPTTTIYPHVTSASTITVTVTVRRTSTVDKTLTIKTTGPTTFTPEVTRTIPSTIVTRTSTVIVPIETRVTCWPPTACGSYSQSPCGLRGSQTCYCTVNNNGTPFCWAAGTCAYPVCTTNADCETDQECTRNTCCGTICQPRSNCANLSALAKRRLLQRFKVSLERRKHHYLAGKQDCPPGQVYAASGECLPEDEINWGTESPPSVSNKQIQK